MVRDIVRLRFPLALCVLALVAGLGFACTGPGAEEPPRADDSSVPSDPDVSTPTPTPSPTFEPAARYKPHPRDVYPNAKRLAGRVVQALTNYPLGSSPREIFRAAVVDQPQAAVPFGRVKPLIHADAASVGEIVYAQLGGLAPMVNPTSASVMVVVEQSVEGETTSVVSRTIDVRLILVSGQWTLATIDSIGGRPLPRPDTLSPLADAVLDNPRILMPDSARWDIYRGIVDERVLRAMDEAARRFPYAVAVVASGHPKNVFGTDLVSNHTVGRAVDLWKVGKRPVFAQITDRTGPAFRLSEAAFFELGVEELGSPWDFDGAASSDSFTNVVHLDHIHIAFDA